MKRQRRTRSLAGAAHNLDDAAAVLGRGAMGATEDGAWERVATQPKCWLVKRRGVLVVFAAIVMVRVRGRGRVYVILRRRSRGHVV